jgi:hypothetical protein
MVAIAEFRDAMTVYATTVGDRLGLEKSPATPLLRALQISIPDRLTSADLALLMAASLKPLMRASKLKQLINWQVGADLSDDGLPQIQKAIDGYLIEVGGACEINFGPTYDNMMNGLMTHNALSATRPAQPRSPIGLPPAMLRVSLTAPAHRRYINLSPEAQSLIAIEAASGILSGAIDLAALAPADDRTTEAAVVNAPIDLAALRAVPQPLSTKTHVGGMMSRALCKVLSGSKVLNEAAYCRVWAASVGESFELEYPCAAGRVDAWFPDRRLCVEAKFWPGWKGALGQALAYRYSVGGNSSAAVLLIGIPDRTMQELIVDTCASVGVWVEWMAL